MPYTQLTPEFNLPVGLHDRLVAEITAKKMIPGAFYLDANATQASDSWLFRLYQRCGFGKGTFRTYRLTDENESLVLNHYRTFVDHVGRPYKIRLKSAHGIRWLFPHSDLHNVDRGIKNPNGDTASIYIGVMTNAEMTNWYSYDGTFEMNRITHLLRLKKEKSICLRDREACLFDNAAIHSVTRCTPSKERWGLAISWQGVSYDVIAKRYLEYRMATSRPGSIQL